MWRFGLAIVAAPLLAQPPLDLVFLLENTPGMLLVISRNDFRTIQPADRVAVMAFTRKSRVVQPFTGDPAAIEKAVRRLAVGGPRWSPLPEQPPQAHVFSALLDAVGLFRDLPADPGRRRAIVPVFGTDDDSPRPAFDDLRRALSTAQIRLYAVAIRRYDRRLAYDPRVLTPPTIGGGNPPIPLALGPLPQATLLTMARLAAAVGGEARSGDAAFANTLRRVRSDADQPERPRAVAREYRPEIGIAQVIRH
ncbi:MAG: hypothetical protein LAP40_16490 [Acidobacteriia bacterium]|nr:hypothetical protein [Terriglobia bacterium]